MNRPLETTPRRPLDAERVSEGRRDLFGSLGLLALGGGAAALLGCEGQAAGGKDGAGLDSVAQALSGASSVRWCDSMAEQQTFVGGTGSSAANVCLRRGYASPVDGGGGLFLWTGDTTTLQSSDPQGGLVVVPNGPRTGCWKRLYDGPVNVKWFGVTGTANDQPIFDAALRAAPHVFVPAGTYNLGSTLAIRTNQVLQGAGMGQTVLMYTGSGVCLSAQDANKWAVRDLSIGVSPQNSYQGVNGIRVAAVAADALYGRIERVAIAVKTTDTGAGISIEHTAPYIVYFLEVRDYVMDPGGTSGPRSTGIRCSGTSSTGCIGAAVWGGRITSARYGMDLDRLDTFRCFGTAFDGMVSSSAGRAVLLRHANFCSFENVRIEPDVDAFVEFTADANDNRISSYFSGAPASKIIDNGRRNEWTGFDSSGGLPDRRANPLVMNGFLEVAAINTRPVNVQLGVYHNYHVGLINPGPTQSYASSSYLRITGPSAQFGVASILPFPQLRDGLEVVLLNTTTQSMVIENNGGGAGSDGILTLTGADVVLPAGVSIARFKYDAGLSRWIYMA